ncbi:MAG: glycerophosphodiester phosphodiesterase [Rubrimonas sp.]|uniref:glycerophosphodiester phosphodiesterase n=1 Tax=Rubrimonas sp. TaxID=2036015 RepID=UPI002FDD5DB6
MSDAIAPARIDAAAARAALARAWRLRRPALALHLAAAILGAAILTPLVGGAALLAARVSGAPAVADQDIARLALSPVGFLAVLAALAVLIAANAVELSAMTALDAEARRGGAPSVWRALRRVAKRAPAILGLAAILALRLMLRAAPFLLIGAVAARALLSEHDVNFYLAERPPEFLRALGLGALLALGLVLVLGERLVAWGLALPAVVLGGLGPRAALAESARLTQGRRLRLALGLGLWALGAVALAVAGAAAAGGAARLFAPSAEAGLQAAALHVMAAVAAIAVINVAVAAAAAASLASLLGGAYAALGGAERLPQAPDAPPRRLPLAALLAAAAVASAVAAGLALSAGVRASHKVEVIAHRGHGAAPENSLPAIEMGVAAGADWIEIDVQETADGAVALIHDRDFMKLAGDPRQVADLTLAELRGIDIGARFSPDFAGTVAPTLAEALEAVRGRAKLLIELKHYGRAVRLEERVAEIVEAAGMQSDIAVMSLDHASAARMKALRPDWRVGLLAATALGDLARLDADFLGVSTRLARPPLIRRARAAGRPLHVWTVNDPVAMSRFVSLGVSGLITDAPELARATLSARAGMTAAERLALLAADLFGVEGKPESARAASP